MSRHILKYSLSAIMTLSICCSANAAALGTPIYSCTGTLTSFSDVEPINCRIECRPLGLYSSVIWPTRTSNVTLPPFNSDSQLQCKEKAVDFTRRLNDPNDTGGDRGS